ncbi:MAG: AMP-binding protein, partial [Sandaracinaceae bacterium]|nr:AMP-binding protein [Sandaracinaceae bacterium]
RDAPDRLAVLLPDRRALTYAGLHGLVSARAEALTLRAGERVALVAEPTLEGVVDALAVLEQDGSLVLLHPRWTPPERAHALERTRPALVLDEQGPRRLPSSSEPASELVIVFTSGTRGTPQGVRLGRAQLEAACEAHARALPWLEHDRWLLAMPLAHVGGLAIVLRCLWARRALALGPARPSPEALCGAVETAQATLLSMVPTTLHRLLERAVRPPPTLRAVLLGGAATPESLLAEGRTAGWPLLPTYGLTECTAQVCTQRLGDERPSGVGPSLPSVEVRVTGEDIEVRGPTRMLGLLGEPDLPPETWYRTGDLGFLDAEGHLHVRGRRADRIVTGGENVDPVEVEACLLRHPAVRGAAIVGLPSAEWGEEVAAVLVLGAPVARAELSAMLLALASFKRPRRLAVARELAPPGSKVSRTALRTLRFAPWDDLPDDLSPVLAD